MKTLRFIVDDQKIERDPNCADFDNLTPDSGDVRLEIYFTKEWRGHVKVVAFYSPLGKEYEARELKDGRSCMVPEEALKKREFKIQVFGRNWDSIIKTNKLAIRQNGGAV